MDKKKEYEIGLIEYLGIVRKRIWLIVVIFVLAVTATAIASFKAKPIYRAVALLRIEMKTPNIMLMQDYYQMDVGSDEYYETQSRLIKSRKICGNVYERLKTTDLREYADSSDPVQSFISAVEVDAVPETYLVDISYESENPERAARIVNAVIDEYIHSVKLDKRTDSELMASEITEQIPALRKRLTDSQEELRRFEREQSALSFEKRREIIYNALSSLNAQLTKVKQETARVEARYEGVATARKTEEILSLPSVVNNTAIQAYGREKLTLDTHRAELVQRYKPESDPVRAVDRKIKVVEEKIMNEATRIAESIKQETLEKKSEEKKLETLLDQQRELAKSFDTNVIRYEELKAAVDSNRKLYEQYVRQQKEIQTSSKFNLNIVQIVDRATVPKNPVRPRKLFNMLMAALISLIGGVALSFLLDHLDDSIKGHDDIDRYVKLPLLGVVPSVKMSKKEVTQKDLLAHQKPKSNISEAYRNIRTSLLYASPNQESKAYVVTSAGPQEGKTTTAINLAIALAHAGKKVLLVDSDLRKPRIHKTFKVDGSRGLTNCLVGQDGPENLTTATEIDNLYFMPSGPIPPNPAELLDSARMKEVIAWMKKSFDTVIFDSPPLVAVTDAAVLAARTDGAIQVIWAGNTSRKIVELGKERIENIGAKIVGVVLNNIKTSSSGYYYYYYPRYYKYYSDKDKSSADK